MISDLAVRLTDALERLYTPRVERVSRRVGLHDTLVDVHDGVWWLFVTLGYYLSDDQVAVSAGGVDAAFHVASWTEYERATTLVGERHVVESLLDDLNEDDAFWDVGANVGTYACLVGRALSDGGVVAFEPHPENVDRLRRNLDLNGVAATVDTRALSDAEGTGELQVVGDDVGAGAHTLESDADGGRHVEVALVRGDTLVEEGYAAPNVVKIDVEGAEAAVLEGMERALADPACRVVYVEVHRSHGVQVEDVRGPLVAAGFETERLDDRGSTTFLRATKERTA